MSQNQRAGEDILSLLHGALAEAFVKRLQSGEYSASDLNVIRQFLKDNEISCDPDQPTDEVSDLLNALPFQPSSPNQVC